MKLYFTESYDEWYNIIEKSDEKEKVGEKKVLMFLECFASLSNYMTAPMTIIDGITYCSKDFEFNTEKDITEFLRNKNFILYRCYLSEYKDKRVFKLRGAFCRESVKLSTE